MAGFFTRLAAKIRKASSTQHEESANDDDDQQNLFEVKYLHSRLHAVVEEEIALKHPTVVLCRNICNLVHAFKTFAGFLRPLEIVSKTSHKGSFNRFIVGKVSFTRFSRIGFN